MVSRSSASVLHARTALISSLKTKHPRVRASLIDLIPCTPQITLLSLKGRQLFLRPCVGAAGSHAKILLTINQGIHAKDRSRSLDVIPERRGRTRLEGPRIGAAAVVAK